MLDIKFIRDNRDTVKEALKNRRLDIDIDQMLKFDEERILSTKDAQVVRLVDDRRDGRADAGGGGAQGKGSGCGRRDDPGVGSMAVYINMH